MRRYYLYIILVVFAIFLSSNTAQPGVWNAGGSGSFTLLYPEDSIAYKKIQMQSENIYMQLYKGFATVKGNYYFKNTHTDTLKIKVGYPINNVFENVAFHHQVNKVRVDGLYKVKGLVNDTNVSLFEQPNLENENWYVWKIIFPPNEITKFTVYFLVNTNNAKITKGYNSERKNAFIYLIETGSLWKSPIEKGNFYTQFKDHLSIKNVKVSLSDSLFFDKEHTTLKFSLTNYGNQPDPNFVLSYGEYQENFNFKTIVNQSETYFKAIDIFSKNVFKNNDFKLLKLENVYEINGFSNLFINALFYIIVYAIPILGGTLIFFIALSIFKRSIIN